MSRAGLLDTRGTRPLASRDQGHGTETDRMRSTERLTGQHGALLVVDVQAKLVPKIHRRDLMIANAVRLVHGAKALGLPVWGTEQYPQGLGPTVAELAELIPDRPSKTTF